MADYDVIVVGAGNAALAAAVSARENGAARPRIGECCTIRFANPDYSK